MLKQAILKAAGPTIESEYADPQRVNPVTGVIVTAQGQLLCQKIFFVPWNPHAPSFNLQKSLKDFVNNAIQCAIEHHFHRIALPAVGMTGKMIDD